MVSLGFIGFGEASFNLAAGLRREGLTKIYTFDVVFDEDTESQAYKQAITRIEQTDSIICHTVVELAESADILVLAVPAQHAEYVADQFIPYLAEEQLLVDVTTASPQVKKRIAERCMQKHILYADSPMLGPLIVDQHKVPIIACGSGAQQWYDTMTQFGMNIELLEGEPGSATQIKLARSIFTKGFEALVIETFLFSKKCGIEALVMKSIGKTLDGKSFEQSALRYMVSNLTHAARKAHEMRDATAIMSSMDMSPLVAEGAAARLQQMADLNCATQVTAPPPSSLAEICSIWEKCGAL